MLILELKFKQPFMPSFLNEMYYAHSNAQMSSGDVDYILKENFQLQEGKQIFLFLLCQGCSSMSNVRFSIIYANSTIATNVLVKDKGSA